MLKRLSREAKAQRGENDRSSELFLYLLNSGQAEFTDEEFAEYLDRIAFWFEHGLSVCSNRQARGAGALRYHPQLDLLSLATRSRNNQVPLNALLDRGRG